MAPHIGRIAFNLGMLVLILAIIPLPFLKPGSAEFVVDLLAIIVAIAFLGFVAWEARREARMAKMRRDQGDNGDSSSGEEASDKS
jgi:hypothetical protein